jgi:hypothetical protein
MLSISPIENGDQIFFSCSQCEGLQKGGLLLGFGGKEFSLEALREKERGDETQVTPKLVEKLVWVPIIWFLVKDLMPYYAETGHSRPLIA